SRQAVVYPVTGQEQAHEIGPGSGPRRLIGRERKRRASLANDGGALDARGAGFRQRLPELTKRELGELLVPEAHQPFSAARHHREMRRIAAVEQLLLVEDPL